LTGRASDLPRLAKDVSGIVTRTNRPAETETARIAPGRCLYIDAKVDPAPHP
jgi:hypothetical protein